jgi:hypothetical protein
MLWQAVRYTQQAGDLQLQSRALQHLSLGLLMNGELEAAQKVALTAGQRSRQAGEWGNYSVVLATLTSLSLARGDFSAVEWYAREALTMAGHARYPWGRVRALTELAWARTLRGAWGEAQAALEQLQAPEWLQVTPLVPVMSRVFRHLVCLSAAPVPTQNTDQPPHLLPMIEVAPPFLAPLCASIEIADRLVAPALAERPYQALSLAAERGIRFTTAALFLIPRVLGMAATLLRWWEKAEMHFECAIRLATKAGAKLELGRCYFDYARMLGLRCRREDHHRALLLVAQACTIFAELAMKPYLQAGEQLSKGLQLRSLWGEHERAEGVSTQELDCRMRTARSQTNFFR